MRHAPFVLRTLLAPLATLAALAAALPAQGRSDYFNVESPQVAPLAIASIAGHDYLLVCNTPANAVEIWDTDEAIQPPSNRFLRRIPVGLEPVSVLWHAAQQRLYTANFLGDSVTSVSVTAPTGPASLSCALDVTRNVGDEPVHLALGSDNTTLLVAFMDPDAIGAFDALTLQPIAPTAAFPAPTDLVDLTVASSVPAKSINEPRRVAFANGQAFVLGHKGGNDLTYDFDLFSVDLATGTRRALGGLGSTNTGMAFASNGDLFVVGGKARNDLIGGPAVAGAATGFVETHLYLVQGAGTTTPTVADRDLNVGAGPADALALPTDLAVYEVAGQPTKVFVAAFGSDRIGIVEPVGAPPAWPVRHIDVSPVSSTGNAKAGPRGFALKPQSATLRARLYVLNRLDNSVSVVDPAAESVLSAFALLDPTPLYVRQGRPFLYDAKLSATGFVACASCHSDGRLDGLGWDLGSPTGLVTAFGRYFADGPTSTLLQQLVAFVQNGFDPNKRLMVTQSLQGLVNHELEPSAMAFATNAPYHWRGDRSSFTKFNEAFVGLMGLPNIGSSAEPQGIPAGDMEKFEEFVNSIHYPPNPEQPHDRVFSGDFGTANLLDGSGAQLGLKLFHTEPIGACNGRSCVECHTLPEGSNNKFTVHQAGGVPLAPTRQPIETAALRGLFQKNAVLERDAQSIGTVDLATSGILHAGVNRSINQFITTAFAGSFSLAQRVNLQEYVREFDWAVAPIVGQLESFGTTASPAALARIAQFQKQALVANAGLCVRASLSGGQVLRGFRYDPIDDKCVEETTTGALPGVPLTAVLALPIAPDDRLLFVCVPLGSERRIAAPDGVAANLPPVTPSSLSLLPMLPNSAWTRVPELIKNWIPVGSGGDFAWNHPQSLPTPLSLHSTRLFQYGLLQAGGFGLPALRHDAPRRFVVAGTGIQPGARLIVHTPNDPAAPVPNSSGPLNQMTTTALAMPLHPTDQRTASGEPIWQTSVELDPRTYYRMMLGGPFAPGVDVASADFNSTIVVEPPPPGFFNAGAYNWHFVQVANPGVPPVDLGWQQLTIG